MGLFERKESDVDNGIFVEEPIEDTEVLERKAVEELKEELLKFYAKIRRARKQVWLDSLDLRDNKNIQDENFDLFCQVDRPLAMRCAKLDARQANLYVRYLELYFDLLEHEEKLEFILFESVKDDSGQLVCILDEFEKFCFEVLGEGYVSAAD